MKDFNENFIRLQLNHYLQYKKRALELDAGYCHGLTLLWLFYISEDQAQWFYTTAQAIADCEKDTDFDAIEADVERFIAHIVWIRYSCEYLRGVNQFDMDQILELPKDFALSFLFRHSELDTLLPLLLKERKLISISGPTHTMGIYVSDGNTYVFDTRYNKFQPKIINDIYSLKVELIKRLFKRDYFPSCRLPLEIVVLSNRDPSPFNVDKEKFYEGLLRGCEAVDAPGLDGYTNMYLACETGDAAEVEQLLEHHSDPNQHCYDGWAPLHVCSSMGKTSIVKLLLRHGAISSQPGKGGLRPIDLAREAGHEDIVTVLKSRF